VCEEVLKKLGKNWGILRQKHGIKHPKSKKIADFESEI
jgi:hypothetical protein